ncbi:hypothetical protein Tco_0141664, partial [Tanacetum coccineum]
LSQHHDHTWSHIFFLSATTPRARVFTPFVIISDLDNEITTLPMRPVPPSPDRTPALYVYPLNSSDDSSDADLSDTAKSLWKWISTKRQKTKAKNDKTKHGMEMCEKTKPKSQPSQKVNRKVK